MPSGVGRILRQAQDEANLLESLSLTLSLSKGAAADETFFSSLLEQIPSEPERFATTYLRKNQKTDHSI